MLVIKVELWPGGNKDRAREIGRIGMANVSNLASTSDYIFVSTTDRKEEAEGFVEAHPRAAGFWKLVARLADLADKGGSEIPEKHQGDVRSVERHMGGLGS